LTAAYNEPLIQADEDEDILNTVDDDQDLGFGDKLELLDYVTIYGIINVMAESLRWLGYVPDIASAKLEAKGSVDKIIDELGNIFSDKDRGSDFRA